MGLLNRWITACALSIFSMTLSAGTMTIVSDEWYPVNGKPRSVKPGYMIEIVRAILAKHNHEVNYILMPWTRSLKVVAAGQHDCVVGASKNEERLKVYHYPDLPQGTEQMTFFVRKGDTWRFNGIDSLKGQRLGVMASYVYDDGPFDAYIKENTKKVALHHGTTALQSAIRKLVKNRIDIIIENAIIVEAKAKDMGDEFSKGIQRAGNLKEPDLIYIACSKAKPTSEEYIQLINKELPKMRSNGELQAILDKYGISDWD